MSRMKIGAVVMAIIIFITPISASASAAYAPALPYIPPTDVQLFDLIYNTYGVTAPTDAADDETRLAGYLDLYSRVLGASNEQFLEDIQTLFTQAKTGRALEISSTLSAQLMQGMKEALANGIQVEAPENITDMEGIEDWLEERYNWAYGTEPLQQIAQANGVINEYNCIVLWNEQGVLYDAQAAVFIVPVQTTCELYNNGKQAVFTNTATSNLYAYSYKLNNSYVWGQQRFNTTINYGVAQQMDTTVGLGGVYAQVSAQNTDIKNRIDAITLHPLTKYTKIENGVIDTTEPIKIDLPIAIPYPANVVADLPDVQDDLGTIPISDNPTQAVAQLQATAAAELGDTQDYALNLTNYFPFCLPFDIARIIGAFVAEPEAPAFSYTIDNPFSDNPEDDITLTIDLSHFNAVASVLRTLESIAFVVGLCAVTRSLYLRG